MTVRLLVIPMLLILTEVSGSACPVGTACVAAETRSSSSKELGVTDDEPRSEGVRLRSRLLDRAFARLTDRKSAHGTLRTTVVAKRGALQLPSMWQALRKRMYTRLPHYEGRNRFSLSLAPVVVNGPTDSAPGIGVQGGF